MKKLLALLIDSLWLFELIIWSAVGVFFYYLKLKGNLLDLTHTINTNFNGVVLVMYSIFIGIVLVYLVVVPYILEATLGQYIMGFKVTSKANKVDPLRLFLFFITAPILNILLLPYAVYLKVKGKSLATKLSDLYMEDSSTDYLKRFLVLIVFLAITTLTLLGINMARSEGARVLTRFIDYKKYADQALKLKDYRTLASILQQYESKYGKDSDYWVYYCVAKSMGGLERDATKLENICKRAIYTNMNKKYHYEILLALIKIYRREDNITNLRRTYKTLWNLGYRGPEILEYIKLTAANSKSEASKMLKDWITSNSLEDLSVKNISAVAELYLELKEYEKAKELFESILNKSKQKNVQAAAYFKLGECYYFLKKYKLAKQYFLKAKELDSHYTNLVESYIIDMSLKGYK